MIKYDLPQQNSVKITIHDFLGRYIKTLVNAVQKEAERIEIKKIETKKIEKDKVVKRKPLSCLWDDG